HLWFQTANDTLPLGYLAAIADLVEAAQYNWGSAILASMYHGLDTAVTTGGAITGFSQLLEYWFYEYCGVGHPIVKEEVKFSAYPCLIAWERRNRKKKNGQPTNLFILDRYHIDHHTIETITWEPCFSGEPEGLDPGWHIAWTGRHEMPPIHRLRDPLPMPSSCSAEELRYLTHVMQRLCLIESARDPQMMQELTYEVATLRRYLDSVDDQLYSHEVRLRRWHDVQVVPLVPGGGSRTRQRRSGPRTRGGGTSRKGWGTGDDSE
ncbi:hypothetical protein GIB67_014080, partial [Kingdonia uniflora]